MSGDCSPAQLAAVAPEPRPLGPPLLITLSPPPIPPRCSVLIPVDMVPVSGDMTGAHVRVKPAGAADPSWASIKWSAKWDGPASRFVFEFGNASDVTAHPGPLDFEFVPVEDPNA